MRHGLEIIFTIDLTIEYYIVYYCILSKQKNNTPNEYDGVDFRNIKHLF